MTDPETCAKKAGIHLGNDQSIIHPPAERGIVRVGGVRKACNSMPPIHCQICYEQKTEYSALQCGHAFCNTCYTEYVLHKIADEGHESVYSRCPAEKVALLATESHCPSTPICAAWATRDCLRLLFTVPPSALQLACICSSRQRGAQRTARAIRESFEPCSLLCR